MSTARWGSPPKTLEFHFSVMPRGIFESASDASSATRTGTASSSSTIIAELARAIGTFALDTHEATAAIPAAASTAVAASPASSALPKRKGPAAAPTIGEAAPHAAIATSAAPSGRVMRPRSATIAPTTANAIATTPSSPRARTSAAVRGTSLAPSPIEPESQPTSSDADGAATRRHSIHAGGAIPTSAPIAARQAIRFRAKRASAPSPAHAATATGTS